MKRLKCKTWGSGVGGPWCLGDFKSLMDIVFVVITSVQVYIVECYRICCCPTGSLCVYSIVWLNNGAMGRKVNTAPDWLTDKATSWLPRMIGRCQWGPGFVRRQREGVSHKGP